MHVKSVEYKLKLMTILSDLIDLGFWIIKLVRTSVTIYVVVSRNFIKVKNLENGKVALIDSEIEFSSERLLIANPIVAEMVAKKLIEKLFKPTELKTRKLNVICHPIDDILAELTPAEKMIFNDFGYQIGGGLVKLIEGKQEKTPIELKELSVF